MDEMNVNRKCSSRSSNTNVLFSFVFCFGWATDVCGP